MVKAPSIENGGLGSGSGERAQVGASDLQASPPSEGNRGFWMAYTKKCTGTQAWSAIHVSGLKPPEEG